ncbi:MAG: hypothetical protein EPN93_09940 [Spirochaetes bacterium]|nr:MAG: hypothetical protein EPN93_09940 [Spirochaetota bacterium]
MNTAISNILIAGILTVIALFRPDLIRNLNLLLLFWVMTGVLMMAMLFVKLRIIRNIVRRSRDPSNYHLNYFGKKVLHENVVQQGELVTFFVTIPFFLMAGAYFLARLTNLLLYGRL